ncbi:MAG: hypothetical protein IPH68_16705 [Chitinophagaceae bacterium]|nr:hypothetical protein [Chitinophagaceae bacterium]
MADFIAPAFGGKLQDHIGAFSVTIQGIEKHIKNLKPAMMITTK